MGFSHHRSPWRFAHGLWRRYHHVNWALTDQALVSGINFATGIILARALGLSEFGMFAMAWMLIEFAAIFQQAAIVMPMMSIGPKQSAEREAGYYGATILQQLVFLFITVLGLTLTVKLLYFVTPEMDLRSMLLPIICAACAHQLQSLLRRYYFTRGRPGKAFLNDCLRYVGQTTVILALALGGGINSVAVLWIMAGFSLLAVILGLVGLEKVNFNRKALAEVTARHWHFSKWMTLSEVMRWSMGDFFLIISGALLGPAIVGALRATKNLIGLCNIIELGLGNVIPVHAARHYHAGGAPELNSFVRKMTIAGVLMMGVIVIAAGVAPEFWLRLVYGEEFAGYGYMVQLWGLILVLGYMGGPIAGALQAMERTRIIFVAYFVTGIVSLALAYPLIEHFGVSGVLWGLALLVTIRNGILFANYRRLSFRDHGRAVAAESS